MDIGGGGFMTDDKMYFVFTTRFVAPSKVCTCISIHTMMNYMDTGEAMVTSNKMDIF